MSEPVHVVIVSGLSGSGKTTALHALEDAGYFCVDNLPSPLLPTFLRLADENASIQRVALAMDVREGAFYADAAGALKAVLGGTRSLTVLFLDAADDKVMARFKETRRRHPLIAQGAVETLDSAITEERTLLQPIRALAAHVIDTTTLTVHALKRQVQGLFGDPKAMKMAVHLVSFGFRHGIPADADYVFDVRFLTNPHFVPELRPKTGLDRAVSDYVLDQPAAKRFQAQLTAMITDVLPHIEAEGRAQVTVAIGCTGGHHRSVAMTEALRAILAEAGRAPIVTHRDIGR